MISLYKEIPPSGGTLGAIAAAATGAEKKYETAPSGSFNLSIDEEAGIITISGGQGEGAQFNGVWESDEVRKARFNAAK
jgi:hypothetical protein